MATIRFKRTVEFMEKHQDKSTVIMDLGVDNKLAETLRSKGYLIENSGEKDLDINYSFPDSEVFTAFEIFEHLFAPFNFLENNSGTLIASVPLKVWFSSAYWNNNDKRDCHYHEFEVKQFNHLLDRTGWKIEVSEVWTTPDKLRLGWRPLLRFIWPSYYIVKATKIG